MKESGAEESPVLPEGVELLSPEELLSGVMGDSEDASEEEPGLEDEFSEEDGSEAGGSVEEASGADSLSEEASTEELSEMLSGSFSVEFVAAGVSSSSRRPSCAAKTMRSTAVYETVSAATAASAVEPVLM